MLSILQSSPGLLASLRVSPLHKIYYEECGIRDGIPVIYIHGGPGGGIEKEIVDILILKHIELCYSINGRWKEYSSF
ncbi:Proline iminopeptidase [Orchesella cincta]|uniref:Proline iminopeptidase n=1 Tax=Orchesella cincta TaxID=48709 RepID=A0A1D2MZK2_ORCCI|nr:Proline iminopeptidase [Orchesella cincta]